MDKYFVVISPSWSLPGSCPQQIRLESYKNKSGAIEDCIEIIQLNLNCTSLLGDHLDILTAHIEKLNHMLSLSDSEIKLKDTEIQADAFDLSIVIEGYWPDVVPETLNFIIETLEEDEEGYEEDEDEEEQGQISSIINDDLEIDCHSTALAVAKLLLQSDYKEHFLVFEELFEYAKLALFEDVVF